jgi:hypothetical protein
MRAKRAIWLLQSAPCIHRIAFGLLQRESTHDLSLGIIRRLTLDGQDQPFMADSSLASRPDAEALARRVARSNTVTCESARSRAASGQAGLSRP